MGRQSEVREKAHKEIEQIAQESVQVESITHHSQQEAEENIGLNWMNLSRIYFSKDETIGEIRNLREKLDDKDYLVTIEEENGEPCLTVQSTKELFDRMI